MEIYATKYYNADWLKNLNIMDYASYVWTPYLNIKSEYRNDFYIYDDEEYASVCLKYIDVDEYLDDPFNYEWCMGSDFDEWEYRDFISQLIKPYNHYLVCAYHCTWDGASGYKIADSIEDALYRDYDCSQYFNGGSRGGKSMMLCEHSHDVPMGHRVVVIGLTDKEYEKLSYWDVDFNTVIKFADEHSKKIIEI